MKTAVSIPSKILKRAEKAAKKRKISSSELITKAVESYLDEYDEAEITAKLNEFYEKYPAEIDPVITEIAARALPQDEW